MARTLTISEPVWQVEPVRDDLQPMIDTYVVLRRTTDAVSRYVETELSQWNISTPQYGVLLHLSRGKPLSLSELSGLVFRSNSTLTSIIDRMEQEGWVARVADANDRRVTTVTLTPKGQELLLEIRKQHRPFLADMMSVLSPKELDQLNELLNKIERRVEERNGSH